MLFQVTKPPYLWILNTHTLVTVALKHSGDIYLSVDEKLDVPLVLCNTKAEAVDINTISCMQECIWLQTTPVYLQPGLAALPT